MLAKAVATESEANFISIKGPEVLSKWVGESEKGRLAILELYTKNMPLAEDVDLKALASMTKGYSGADIEALCREAALIALRNNINAKKVTMADFQEAMKRVGPSITPDMENWYKNWSQQFKRIQKAAPPLIT